MLRRCTLLALLLLPSAAAAQQPGPGAAPVRIFESWEPAGMARAAAHRPALVIEPKDRVGNALLGGAIGTVAGVAFCTAFSNLVNEGTGFSTCTTRGYLLTGGVGLALGLLVGLAL